MKYCGTDQGALAATGWFVSISKIVYRKIPIDTTEIRDPIDET